MRWRFMVAGLLLAVLVACGAQKESGTDTGAKESDEVATRDINAVLADHTEHLMSLASVVGLAVGELDDNTPCLLIMLSEDNAETKRKIPARIEGHPTKVVVSGQIKPM